LKCLHASLQKHFLSTLTTGVTALNTDRSAADPQLATCEKKKTN